MAAERYSGASQMASSTALVRYVSPGCGASVRSCAKGLPGAADPKLLSFYAPIAAAVVNAEVCAPAAGASSRCWVVQNPRGGVNPNNHSR